MEKKQLTNKQRVDGSGFFFFKSELTEDQQIEILNWVESLSTQYRDFLDRLIHESIMHTEFFSQSDE